MVHIQLPLLINRSPFDSKLEASKNPIWCNFHQSEHKFFIKIEKNKSRKGIITVTAIFFFKK